MCPKGIALPWTVNRPDRLDHPLVMDRQTSWTDALDDLGGKLAELIEEHGPNAVGICVGSGCDSLGMQAAGRWRHGLGTEQFYTPMTVDIAPAVKAAELVTGYGFELFPKWVPEDDDVRLLVICGSNPMVSHGYVGTGGFTDGPRTFNRFRERGGKIWTIDPVRTRTADLSDHHLAVLPGSDAVVLAWLVRQALDRLPSDNAVRSATRPHDLAALRTALAGFELETVATAAGVPSVELEQLWSDIAEAGRIAFPTGSGLTFGPHALVSELLRWALLILTDSLEKPGGMWFDPGWFDTFETRKDWSPAPEGGRPYPPPATRPDLPRINGDIPEAALADEIENGALRALIVVGASPLTAVPDPDRLKRAIASLDVLAVGDIIPTPLTEMASHVFPLTSQLERVDLWTVNEVIGPAYPQLLRPVVRAPTERRSSVHFFAQLAKRLGGLELITGGMDPELASDEDVLESWMGRARHSIEQLREAMPYGIAYDRKVAWALDRAIPDGTWRIAPQVLLDRLPGLLADHAKQGDGYPLLLTSGRQIRRVNSMENARRPRDGEAPDLRLAACDADRLGVSPGDAVAVRSANGALAARASIDDRLRRGVVSLPHGWHEANTGHLTDAGQIDPQTGQPQMTAIPVSVEPLAP
jgi:anaerobic selenocysteine-containing dehydrogenase